MPTKLITFKDLNRETPLSTAIEHTNILLKEGKVLWGQWSGNNSRDSISPRAYKEMNNAGKGCIVYAYDKKTSLLKMQVDRVLKTDEVIDEGLENYIPNYYGINQPAHYYLLISAITMAAPSQASQLIVDSGHKRLIDYDRFQINNAAPWNVHEYEVESNELLIPKNPFIINDNIKALKTVDSNIKSSNKIYVVYRLYYDGPFASQFSHAQYIGETNDFDRRMQEHFNPNNILNNSTTDRHLYNAMYMLGIENFKSEILETDIPSEELARSRESYWIDVYHSYIGDHGLNKRKEYQKIKVG